MLNNVFGFAVGSTGRILYQLKNINCCYLVFSNNLDKYIEMLLHDQPKFVIGIGWNDDMNQDNVVIENADQERINLASLKITEQINQKELNAKYKFLKIPRNMVPGVAIQKVDQEIHKFTELD